MKWSAGSSDTLFGVGSKFLLDSDASLHAKINNKSLIGLGYQQKLRQGIVDAFVKKTYSNSIVIFLYAIDTAVPLLPS